MNTDYEDLLKCNTLSSRELLKTVLTLNLAIAQIDLSMTEGEYSVNSLIENFNYMHSEIARIRSAISSPDASIEDVIDTVNKESKDLDVKFSESIIAFQFYDKLSQRLHHVSESLSALTDIVSNQELVIDNQVWDNFVAKMERYSSMREEYELFEMIFNAGVSTQQAVEDMKSKMRLKLQIAREKHKSDAPDYEDDIELF